jgi:hypothetical protein
MRSYVGLFIALDSCGKATFFEKGEVLVRGVSWPGGCMIDDGDLPVMVERSCGRRNLDAALPCLPRMALSDLVRRSGRRPWTLSPLRPGDGT